MAYEPTGDAYTQHYFDSRGVVRLYAMTFRDGICTPMRDSPDFTPLDFWQRFTGRFSADGNTISCTWETGDGSSWNKDFDLTYARIKRGSPRQTAPRAPKAPERPLDRVTA